MIEFHQVSKQYPGGNQALANVSFTIGDGELVYLSGPSGAGKSTLLKMIAGVEKPSSGRVTVNGQDVGQLNSSGLPYLRRKMGLIFQDQRLLLDRDVLANVMLPLLVTGTARAEADQRARAALDRVGLLNKADAAPQSLSGGEQQRVAVARAIVNRPRIILADEPTANLDKASAARVMSALQAFQSAGITCIIATHDESVLATAPRIISIVGGRLAGLMSGKEITA
ncbi:cell division transport system ATP-binding protein [Noviherbaspirillum humi]|uniref:Cell division ATP-binding protein FtsE n=1 Tax=Noviherbaspirillum humi TaxID=1688639 RepID=A0A239CK24_9BURK|nr:ATP-binding cassette domain-containing protein [Noviherbaspirillum humi]SNS20048.1 cell division transport system ATP-binding protein [Noviherbaspirillum humi]